jgi:DNA-binding MarR family transcriptional regulator
MAGSSKSSGAETTGRPPATIRSACLRIARDLRTALDRDLAPFGLRTQQAAVLLRCCRMPGANPSQLAAAVGTDTAGITGLIDHLEKRGLVSRRANPADRRAVIVEPTEMGRALVPRLRQIFQAVNELLLTGFSPPEVASLEAMLERLLINVRARLDETSDIEAPSRRPRQPRPGAPQGDVPNQAPNRRRNQRRQEE